MYAHDIHGKNAYKTAMIIACDQDGRLCRLITQEEEQFTSNYATVYTGWT